MYLVGFMCTGKTTCGRRLAVELELPFLDLDEEVERRAGRSVTAIWNDEGESGFREREHQALLEVAGSSAVIATGGGVMVLESNRELLQQTGCVLWLRAPFAVIWRRESCRSGRPLWRDESQLRALFSAREKLYHLADCTVDAGKEPEMVVQTLARGVREWMRRR